MEKGQLRLNLQKQLCEMSPEQRMEKSKKACRNLVSTEQFQNASVIMMYLAIPNEADSSEAILSAWQLDKTVVVPKILWEHKRMIPVQIHSLDAEFSMEVSGLRNPVNGVPIPFEQIDMVVTPALAFDRNGNRLGRGGAYYDKFFANKELTAARCGFAFSEQVVETVPVTEYDVPMDFVVTDESVISINNIGE